MIGNQPLENLEIEHRPERIRRRLTAKGRGGYVGDAMLGAIDGAITSFAIVAGAVGGGFSRLVLVQVQQVRRCSWNRVNVRTLHDRQCGEAPGNLLAIVATRHRFS